MDVKIITWLLRKLNCTRVERNFTNLKRTDNSSVPVQAVSQDTSVFHNQAVLSCFFQTSIQAVELHQSAVNMGIRRTQLELRLQQVIKLVPALLPLCTQQFLLDTKKKH